MPRYLNQANECTNPAAGDWLWIFDNDAALNDYDRKLNIGRLAILENANTFAATGTSTIPVTVNMPVSASVEGVRVRYNGVTAIQMFATASSRAIAFPAFDNGASFGPYLNIGRNSNATTPAAGHLLMYDRAGSFFSLWVDAASNLRILTNSQPTNATDASGAVVGTQTSWVGIKEDIAEWDDPQAALDAVLACKLFHYHLKGDASRRQYAGLVISDADRGEWFSENDGEGQVPALNERNLFGYLIAAIQAQQAQIADLKARLEKLEG